MKLLVSLIGFFTDVEVYPQANIPTGWLAVASKQGRHVKKRYKNKEEFLKSKGLKNE